MLSLKTFFILMLTFLSFNSYGVKRLIIKYKNSKTRVNQAKSSGLRINSLKNSNLGKDILFHRLNQKANRAEIQSAINEISKDPNVEYVEEDLMLQAVAAPNDPEFINQRHHYQGSTDGVGGANLIGAWVQTTGLASQVVAVVDTGYLNHPELSGRILQGYDFISDSAIANDGGGRDSDASDPGDWIDSSDSCYSSTGSANSTWHGTHVAGTIAANTNNGKGVAGINWNTKILPVRALGKCGGLLSDIAAGIRWAAGGEVSGAPTNQHPAQVINLSIGGVGACGPTLQSAIDFAFSKGVAVIVAAGNDDTNLSSYTPANCANVIRVGAIDSYDNKASYSNYGNGLDIMAPGGATTNIGVISTSNSGLQNPNLDPKFGFTYSGLNGTSMAAPHVSGVASLMFAINRELGAGQILNLLRDSARDFSQGTTCLSNPGFCGSGVLNAMAAVQRASVETPDPSVPGNIAIPFSGASGSRELASTTVKEGGGCGTIDFTDGGSGGSGPLTLAFGFFISFLIAGIISSKKKMK